MRAPRHATSKFVRLGATLPIEDSEYRAEMDNKRVLMYTNTSDLTTSRERPRLNDTSMGRMLSSVQDLKEENESSNVYQADRCKVAWQC